jgi:hypothetical protein
LRVFRLLDLTGAYVALVCATEKVAGLENRQSFTGLVSSNLTLSANIEGNLRRWFTTETCLGCSAAANRASALLR